MSDSERKIDDKALLQTSIRIRADLKKRVDHMVVERGSSLQKAIDHGLELWLAASPQLPAGSPAKAQDVTSDMDSSTYPRDIDTLFQSALAPIQQQLVSINEQYSAILGELRRRGPINSTTRIRESDIEAAANAVLPGVGRNSARRKANHGSKEKLATKKQGAPGRIAS